MLSWPVISLMVGGVQREEKLKMVSSRLRMPDSLCESGRMYILILFVGMIAWTFYNRNATKYGQPLKGGWMLVVAWFVVLIMGLYRLLK